MREIQLTSKPAGRTNEVLSPRQRVEATILAHYLVSDGLTREEVAALQRYVSSGGTDADQLLAEALTEDGESATGVAKPCSYSQLMRVVLDVWEQARTLAQDTRDLQIVALERELQQARARVAELEQQIVWKEVAE